MIDDEERFLEKLVAWGTFLRGVGVFALAMVAIYVLIRHGL